jgi:protein-disulfide isomerase/uncharacterized membrane protein
MQINFERALMNQPNETKPEIKLDPKTELGAKFDLPLCLMGVVGFFTSLYALIEHVKLKQSGGSPLSCDVNNLVNCSTALSSSYGQLFEIPLGAYGMSFFGIIIALSLLSKLTDVSNKWIGRWKLLVSSVGVIVSAFLAYISYGKLNVVCPVCSSVHAISLFIFLWSLFFFIKNKSSSTFAHPSAFLKLVSLSLALGVPPLVAGLLTPALASMFQKNTATTPSTVPTPAVASSTPFPAEWLSVSRSNFVGKGEDYRLGNDNAKVVLQMFSDFECPHCKYTSENIKTALAQIDSSKVLFVYKNFPLSSNCNRHVSSGGHKHACSLASAARCAGQQGKFWEFKEWAFTGIEMSEAEKEKNFSQTGLQEQAQKLGLDTKRFAQCVASKVEYAKIQEDADLGQKLGLKGTPLLILNGQTFEGARNSQDFVSVFNSLIR